MLDQLVKQMAEQESITEHLTPAHPMEWVGRMNNRRHRIEEIIIEAVALYHDNLYVLTHCHISHQITCFLMLFPISAIFDLRARFVGTDENMFIRMKINGLESEICIGYTIYSIKCVNIYTTYGVFLLHRKVQKTGENKKLLT